jgi:hypothetical protein
LLEQWSQSQKDISDRRFPVAYKIDCNYSLLSPATASALMAIHAYYIPSDNRHWMESIPCSCGEGDISTDNYIHHCLNLDLARFECFGHLEDTFNQHSTDPKVIHQ